VVILPVKERNPRRTAVERSAKRQAAETRAQNDNVRIHLFHLGNNFKCPVEESKSSKLFSWVTRWPRLQNARCLPHSCKLQDFVGGNVQIARCTCSLQHAGSTGIPENVSNLFHRQLGTTPA
jgi:hypothetical protein